MNSRNRFLVFFFVVLLFVFFSQSYLYSSQEQSTLEQQLAKARSKSSTGLIMTIVGSVIFTGSMILTFADQKEVLEITATTITYDKKIKGIYVVGDILGLVAGAAGLAIHLPARKEVKRLEKEKGLTARISLGVVPEYRATGIKITISF